MEAKPRILLGEHVVVIEGNFAEWDRDSVLGKIDKLIKEGFFDD